MNYAEQQRKIREAVVAEIVARKLRRDFASPGGLYAFLKYFWDVIEPDTPLIEGWAMEAVCEHLEAVEDGRIRRLLINISPGSAKSIICSVAFPLWCWSAKNHPSMRFLNLSYSSSLPERDNRRMLLIIKSDKFKRLYGNVFRTEKEGQELITNNKTGYKMALGVQGSLSGHRGDVLLYDDPNSITEVESDAIRKSTQIAFQEAASNRLNDMKTSAIVVIQQRSHEGDISGFILDEGLPYVHLCIPARYEDGRHCTTRIGWSDPRSQVDESFWPERFPDDVLVSLEKEVGPIAWAGQYCQRPEVRGGGLIKREWWQTWEGKKFPECDFTLASLDPAFTSREENDPSGFTVWGAFLTDTGHRALVLMHAFRKRLELCGPETVKRLNESYSEFKLRTAHKWGLVEHVHDCCKRFRVDHLIVEAKGPGHSVVQTMARLFPSPGYSVQLIDPKKLDKVSRAIRVVPEFTSGQIYAPDKSWADMVISECAVAPRGRTDDLFDSSTQAIYWLRQNGFLERAEEQFLKREDAIKKYKPQAALYPI